MTVNERIAALRAALIEAGCDAYLIPTGDPHASEYLPAHYNAREYFSGFTGENSTLVVTRTKSALWVDGRFFVQAEKQLAGTEIERMCMGEPSVPTEAEYCAAALENGQVLGLCGLTAASNMVKTLEEALAKKGAVVKSLNLEDALWTENRPAKPSTRAWLLPVEFAGLSPAQKIENLRKKLADEGCNAAFIAKLDHVAWLLNLRALDINCTPFALAYCHVSPTETTLFIDTRRLCDDAAKELAENGICVKEYDDVLAHLQGETAAQTLLADSSAVNFAAMGALKENSAFTLKEAADPIILMKGVKSDIELMHTKNAHIKDGVAMVRFEIELEARLAAGEVLFETDIDTILHKYRSAEEHFIVESFDTIAAYGPNAAMMHYHAEEGTDTNSEILRRGFLLVDSGATYLDGTTDITRTFPVGELTLDEQKFYTWTLQSHIDMARAVWLDTCTGKMLDMLARQPLWAHLINYRCGTGHGVGFVGNVHEGPQSLSPRGEAVFVPGMTITDEPGVYESDLLGIRIENELVCVAKETNQYGNFLAFEPITYAPIDTKAVLLDEMTKDQLAWLNDFHALVYEKLSPRLNDAEKAWLKAKTAPLGK